MAVVGKLDIRSNSQQYPVLGPTPIKNPPVKLTTLVSPSPVLSSMIDSQEELPYTFNISHITNLQEVNA